MNVVVAAAAETGIVTETVDEVEAEHPLVMIDETNEEPEIVIPRTQSTGVVDDDDWGHDDDHEEEGFKHWVINVDDDEEVEDDERVK